MEYEGLTSFCCKCDHVGHKESICKSGMQSGSSKQPLTTLSTSYTAAVPPPPRHGEKENRKESNRPPFNIKGKSVEVHVETTLELGSSHNQQLGTGGQQPGGCFKGSDSNHSHDADGAGTEVKEAEIESGIGPWMMVPRRRKPPPNKFTQNRTPYRGNSNVQHPSQRLNRGSGRRNSGLIQQKTAGLQMENPAPGALNLTIGRVHTSSQQPNENNHPLQFNLDSMQPPLSAVNRKYETWSRGKSAIYEIGIVANEVHKKRKPSTQNITGDGSPLVIQ